MFCISVGTLETSLVVSRIPSTGDSNDSRNLLHNKFEIVGRIIDHENHRTLPKEKNDDNNYQNSPPLIRALHDRTHTVRESR
jgi:hypothetical protein